MSNNKLLGKALARIQALTQEAIERHIAEPTTAALATASLDAQPSVRTVYISAIQANGLVFFANMHSGKGRQITANPRVGLCLFWPAMRQQVIVEGSVVALADEAADALWHQRSRDSRLAAWASDQSSHPEATPELLKQRDEVKHKLSFEDVPRPDNWQAQLVLPDKIEFWATGWQHLHSRQLYFCNDEGEWAEQDLNP